MDGDTLILNGSPYRLDGVDAPETDQVCLDAAGAVWTCGIEARDQRKTLLASATFAAKANNTIRSTETGASAFVEFRVWPRP